jgi:leader peptidase (prepilin peptidase)/N-methyltransferase
MASAPEIVIAALVGAAIGSFLNVVIYRLPAGESIVKPRSRCPHCGTQLSSLDNVPIVSWLVLRGRCRHCSARISVRYPVVELLTAATFAAVVGIRGFDDDLLLELPFVAALIALAFIDFDHRILPNAIVYPLTVYGIVAAAVVDTSDLPEHLIAGAGAFLFLLLAVLAYPSGMGMGDVKLALLLGAMLGRTVGVALMVGMFAALVPSIVLMARYGSAARKMALPFAPFLALGGVVALFFGERLLDAYLSSF